LAGGWLRFAAVRLTIDGTEQVVALGDLARTIAPLPAAARDRISRLCDALIAPRAAVAGLTFDSPHVMGIVNVTPDSFSDGALRPGGPDPVAAARAMIAAGASLVDVGGESTRPGAADVTVADELARVAPILAALAGPVATGGMTSGSAGTVVPGVDGDRSALPLSVAARSAVPVSIDTRKSAVMAAALDAGAVLVNDVSALTFDPAALALVAARGASVVLMHAQGTPATMQAAPHYGDPVAEVFDWLEARIAACVAAGIDRTRLIVDPGIGFGKTAAHNTALLRGLATFHALGVPVLLGASRKAVVPALAGDRSLVEQRLGGSLALALHGVAHGIQIVRVHDVAETVQAVRVWTAIDRAA